MINKIIDAISNKLFKVFNKDCTIYKEYSEQKFVTPSIFINVVSSDREQIVGNRYHSNNAFDVCYFPTEKSDEKRAEILEAASLLYDGLEYIELDDGDLLRGTNMHTEIVDNVLHFLVQYNLILKKLDTETDKMEILKYRKE